MPNAVVRCKAYAWATAEGDLSLIVVKTMWVKQMDVWSNKLMMCYPTISFFLFMFSWVLGDKLDLKKENTKPSQRCEVVDA